MARASQLQRRRQVSHADLGRDFKPTFGEEEFENVYRDMERVYLVTLAKETESPLARAATKWVRTKKDEEKEDGRKEGRR